MTWVLFPAYTTHLEKSPFAPVMLSNTHLAGVSPVCSTRTSKFKVVSFPEYSDTLGGMYIPIT